ncbi:MAG: hypothetical protein LBV17_09860 [Treponema sp.]|jgi:uncharacterized membrane protein|nr:hypothetical protein [Treponema sp.]
MFSKFDLIIKSILFLIIITAPVFVNAQENIMININVGNLGFGVNFPLDEDYDKETIVTLLNIGIEHAEKNIGIEFTPFKYFDWVDKYGNSYKNTLNISLFNLKLYWNILNLRFVYLGPFTSIDYLFVEKTIRWNSYVFTGGIHIGFRLYSGIVNYNIFSIEMGYRNINGRSKYFIGAKIDIPALVISALILRKPDSSEEK